MLQNSIILLFTWLILLLPLVFWMYIFVTFFESWVSRKQFIFGIGAGMISSFPLVYGDVYVFWDILKNIFFSFSVLSSSFFWGQLFWYLSMFFLIIWGTIFVLSYIFQNNKKLFFKVQGISFFSFLILLIFWIGSMIFFDSFLGESIWEKSVGFWDMTFISLGAIIWYYIIISLLEEGSKYISSLSLSGKGEYFQVFQKYICLNACIALGFAFFENILYTHSFLLQEGISYSLVQIVFFRSIFSIIIHLVASMLFAMGIWYLLDLSTTLYKALSSFLFLIFLGIGSHVFFDTSLTFDFIGFIFLYIIVIYFILSYLTLKIE